MDIFTATMIAEGSDGFDDETEETVIEAWQTLIDTGVAWNLQGCFGRMAAALIDEGTCTAARSE